MAQRNTFQSWWRDVPLDERPALKVLLGVFMIAMTLAAAAVLSQYLL
ncbi:hypothetical protein [Henriciella mobilis]|nr:hypothetical protein [Henriciella mobilis]